MSHRIQSFIRDLKVPGDLQPRVTPAMVKLILYTLGSRADFNTLECYPSKERIAKESGAHLSTVKRVLNLLEEVGIIVRWRRKTDTGSWAESHYRLVLDVKLPAGWSLGSEKSEEKHGGFSENPRKKTKQSGPELAVIDPAPSEPGPVPSEPGWVPSEPLTTKEPPLQPPTHIQTASPKQSGVCDSSKLNLTPPSSTATEATGQIFEMWPVDYRKIKRSQLQLMIQTWEQDNNRSAIDLVQAARVYLKAHTSTPSKITWLRQWLEREDWTPCLPRSGGSPSSASKASETPEERARWDRRFDHAMSTGEWWKAGEPVRESCLTAPVTAWLRAFVRSPDEKCAGKLLGQLSKMSRVHCHKHYELFEDIDRLDYDFASLKKTGVWGAGPWPDPRTTSAMFPGWLLAKWEVAPSRSAA